MSFVTAARAYEYEVPPESDVPADALRAAEGGQVVYLTRHGRRVAAVVPPEPSPSEVLGVAAKQFEDDVAAACRRLSTALAMVDEETRVAVQTVIDQLMATAEDAADITAAWAAESEGGTPIPAERIWAELGL